MVKSDLCDVPVEGVVSVENVCGGTVNVGVGVDVVEEGGGGAAPVSCDVGGLHVELVRIPAGYSETVVHFRVTDTSTGDLFLDDGRRSGEFGSNTFFLDKSQMGDYVENSWVRFEKIDNGVITAGNNAGSNNNDTVPTGNYNTTYGDWYAIGTHERSSGIVNTGIRVTYHDPESDEGDEVYDLMVGIPPLVVNPNGGGAVVSADKCIRLPSGNVYLQLYSIQDSERFNYKIFYDDGTPYDLVSDMVQQRGNNAFYWVEDTSLPSSATYDAPLVTFEEFSIDDEPKDVGAAIYQDVTEDTIGVYLSRALVALHQNSNYKFKVGVQYPNSEEKEYLYF